MTDRTNGCNQCRDFWQFSTVKLPLSICSNDNRQARLYQCPNCLSFWEESQRFACILTEDELSKFYPNCYSGSHREDV